MSLSINVLYIVVKRVIGQYKRNSVVAAYNFIFLYEILFCVNILIYLIYLQSLVVSMGEYLINMEHLGSQCFLNLAFFGASFADARYA